MQLIGLINGSKIDFNINNCLMARINPEDKVHHLSVLNSFYFHGLLYYMGFNILKARTIVFPNTSGALNLF